MRYYVLLALVTAAGFAVASLLCAAAVTLAWPVMRQRLPTAAAARAWRLAALRLAPLTVGVAASAIAAMTFIRFEPLDTNEDASVTLLVVAAITAWLTGRAVARAAAAARTGRQCR